jgi:hypothetical protein
MGLFGNVLDKELQACQRTLLLLMYLIREDESTIAEKFAAIEGLAGALSH